MPATTREGNILQIGATVRVESGPVLRREVATPELLDDSVTAAHYAMGRRDAQAKVIVEGEEMAFLDWNGHGEGREGATAFYVYQRQPLTAEELAAREITEDVLAALPDDAAREEATIIWREIGCEADEQAAITLATDTLLAGGN